MKQRFFSLLLTAALLCGMLPAGGGTVLAAEADLPSPLASTLLSGNVAAAVNTQLSAENNTVGSFSSAQGLSDPFWSMIGPEEESGISDILIDPETGEQRRIRSLTFPELTPGEVLPLQQPLMQVKTAPTYVGDVRNIPDNNKSFRSVRCLYIGLYCTVWGATDDVASVCINSSIAKDIANSFDSYYPAIVNSFGSWYDTDGDGKLAIFCYDIDHDAVNGISNSYTAGFFRPQDLIDSTGRIGNFNFGSGNYIGMGLDCIHLDTYPAMGSSSKLGNVSNAYSTLVHETQHLISFSNQITQGKYYGQMETWLNEAFSMAAEHMICGSDSTASRVRYFNNNYTAGTALTYWGGTLSNYANSYLFGQYIRTRYGTQTGTDGSTLFKATLDAWQSAGGGDTLAIIADILDTTPKQLVLDFWAAVYLKEASGSHGFRGEGWAQGLTVQTQSISASTATAIYNGGAKFYTIPAAGFTVGSQTNLEFLCFSPEGGLVPEGPPAVSDLTALRTAADQITLTLTASKPGLFRYAVSDTPITDKGLLTGSLSLSWGVNTLSAAINAAGTGKTTLYYCTESVDGVTSGIGELAISACPPPVVIQSSTGGSLQLSWNGSPINSGDPVPIGAKVTVTVLPDSGYAFSHLTVNGQQVDGFTFTMPDADSVTVAVVFVPIANFVTGGSCGTDVLWYLTDENADGTGETMTVYGYGEMPDYGSSSDLPWSTFDNQITTVVVRSGITGIGSKTFLTCPALAEVVIPDSVTVIGQEAFFGCRKLTRIILPRSITVIGRYAFYDCGGLSDVYFLGSRDQWDSITIHYGNDSLAAAALHLIEASQVVTPVVIQPEGGTISLPRTLLRGETVTVTAAPAKNYIFLRLTVNGEPVEGRSFLVPEAGAVTVSAVFVPVPNSLDSGSCGDDLSWYLTDTDADGIGETLVIHGSGEMRVTRRASDVPWHAYRSSIKSIILSPGLTTISNYAFEECTNLTSITIPEGVASLGYYVFNSCSNLQIVNLPQSLIAIGMYAFGSCSSLRNIDLPRNLSSIDSSAFKDCTSLQSIVIPEGIDAISQYCFMKCSSLESVTFPQGLEKISYCAFNDCTSLNEVILPQGLTAIDGAAFKFCRSLRSIVIPDSVTAIDSLAFSYAGLTDVYYFGTQDQWKSIDVVDSGNEPLTDATLHLIHPSDLITPTIIQPAGGTIALPGICVKGGSVAVTAVPAAENYVFSHLLVNGQPVSGTSFTMPEADSVTVTAVFRKLYDITLTVTQPANGTLELSKSQVLFGETVTVTAVPAAENYVFSHLLVNGEPVSSTSFTVPEADSVTVTAVFRKLYDIILTVTQPANGTLELSKSQVLFGETVTVAVSANPGYEFAWLLVGGVRQDGLTFTVPETDSVTVTALFSKDGLLTHSASENGAFTVTAAQFRESAAVGFLVLYSAEGKMLCMVQRELPLGQDAAFTVALSGLKEAAASCRMHFAVDGSLIPMAASAPISLP